MYFLADDTVEIREQCASKPSDFRVHRLFLSQKANAIQIFKHLNLLKEFAEVSGRIVVFIFVVCSEASDRRSRTSLCHSIRSLLMFPMTLNDMVEKMNDW